MTAQPEPRHWYVGDPEPPADVTVLRYERATLPHRYLRRSDEADFAGPGGWVLEASPVPETWSPCAGWPWSRRVQQTNSWGPLTEVLPAPVSSPEPSSVLPSPQVSGESEWVSVSEIAGFLSTIMNTEQASSAAEFLDRGYRLVPREETP
jgi:hypothetical protein